MSPKLLTLFALIIAILATIFAFQNAQIVTIKAGLWATDISAALLILISFGFGFLFALLLVLPEIWTQKVKSFWLHSKVKKLEKKSTSKE